ncbi:MAG: aminoglycoside phosphotransferase family protein [Burkholderiaceae bacterium]
MDARLDQLRHWLDALPASWQLDPGSIAPASGDASFRRYFRIKSPGLDAGSAILMDAPPDREDCRPFLHAAAEFRASGITVPAVHASDLDQGFLLLEDFGSVTYLAVLDEHTAPALYGEASEALVTLQRAGGQARFSPYDATLLEREIDLFVPWYVERHLGLTLTDRERDEFQRARRLLVDCALAQPQVTVHRDYHSRNLMLLPGERNPGILDFQDAVSGPITYDLVSLLRDAYIAWDEEQVLDACIRHWERARKAGLPVADDFGAFYRDFEWMGLQRHLKVLGIFARLCHRDGKPGYLGDCPRVMNYAQSVARRYIDLTPLAALLDRISGTEHRVGHTF